MKATKSQHRLLRLIARFLHFYPGHTISDVEQMDCSLFYELIHETYNIEKERIIAMVNASAFPHLNKGDQRAMIRDLRIDEIPDYAMNTGKNTEQQFSALKQALK